MSDFNMPSTPQDYRNSPLLTKASRISVKGDIYENENGNDLMHACIVSLSKEILHYRKGKLFLLIWRIWKRNPYQDSKDIYPKNRRFCNMCLL